MFAWQGNKTLQWCVTCTDLGVLPVSPSHSQAADICEHQSLKLLIRKTALDGTEFNDLLETGSRGWNTKRVRRGEEGAKKCVKHHEKRTYFKHKIACLWVYLWGKHVQPEWDCLEPHEGLSAAPGRTLAAGATPAWFFQPCLNEAAVSVLPLSALVNLHIDSSALLCISFN